jgi:uncharacterized RDD family membrane protein YckC
VELDETVSLAGAEGIDLDLPLAGIASRSGALIIDLVLQIVAFFVLGFVASFFTSDEGDGAGVALVSIGAFAVLFAYPIVADAFFGRTLGKAALGLAVVRTDGAPITFLASAIRNLVRAIDLLPGGYLVGLIAVLASKQNQRLGDMAAGTLVVRRQREQQVVGGPAAFDPLFGQLPPAPPDEIAAWDTSAVTAEEVAAVRAFLGRRHQIDAGHRHQLADALARALVPKVAGVPLDGGPEAFLERVAYARALR